MEQLDSIERRNLYKQLYHYENNVIRDWILLQLLYNFVY